MKMKKTTLTILAVAAIAQVARPAPIPYPIGVWASFAVLADGGKLPQALIDNKGLVGLAAQENWDEIQTGPDTFDWTSLDKKIAAIKAGGYKYINLNITAGSDSTPQWLLDSLPAAEVIYMRDPGTIHKTYCDEIKTAVYWSPAFHAGRLNLIKKAGERYANDPAIVAVTTQFFNHHSSDWNTLDTIGTIGPCGDGKTYNVNQPQQWIDAGWTIQKVQDVGTQILDAAAAAFPNQSIKLPIGGLADELVQPFLGPDSGYGSLAKIIVEYVATKPYANRFYPQRNTVSSKWGTGPSLDPPDEPTIDGPRYPQKLVWDHSRPDGATPKLGGLQMVGCASDGATTACRQGGGPTGPCGPDCDPVCVLQTSLDISRTYNTSFIEIWAQDAMNPRLYSIAESTTLAMGGQLRDAPAAPTNLQIVP